VAVRCRASRPESAARPAFEAKVFEAKVFEAKVFEVKAERSLRSGARRR